MQKRQYVLFDFDGVIADSYAVAWDTARTLCKVVSEKEYKEAFEGNVLERHDAMMNRDHGPECRHDLDWFSIFVPAFEQHVQPFPGMAAVVEKLSHEYTLIILSSTITSPIQGFLEKHRIGRYFSEVMGADVHTSKVEKMKMVFEKYVASASECIFITDTLGDMREAEAAGVGAIGVPWGFHSRETLETGRPFRIVERPEDIPGAIAQYFTGA
jgi:phosphoglycolate phosphatase-like HAD superfamily hydrolase